MTSLTVWPPDMPRPSTLILPHDSCLPHGLDSLLTKLWFLDQHHIHSLAKFLPPFPLSLYITLAQKFPTWLNPSVHLYWVVCEHLDTAAEKKKKSHHSFVDCTLFKLMSTNLKFHAFSHLWTSPKEPRWQTCLLSYRENTCATTPIKSQTFLLFSGEAG